MPKVHRLTTRLKTKDLLSALAEFMQLLEHAEVTDRTSVHLFTQTSHPAPIGLLAEALPADSRGFTMGLDQRNWSAAEIRAVLREKVPAPRWVYSGDVVPLLDFAGFLKLIVAWQNLRPDPLRRSSLNLEVRKVSWRGSATGSTGAVELDDAKVFGGKIRFTLTLLMEQPDSRTPAEAKAELKAIAEATGIDFKDGEVYTKRDPNVEQQSWEKLPVACHLFDHCVESVSNDLLAAGFDWRSLPSAYPHQKGSDHRWAQYGQSPARSFRWESQINQFVRANLPGFKKTKEIEDGYFYAAPLAPGWELLLHVDTHPGRYVGRLFKLRGGVRNTDPDRSRFRRLAPVLRCAGGDYHGHWDCCPEFAFDTAEELDQLLAALTPFLQDFLRRLTVRLQETYLSGLTGEWNSLLPVAGPLTAREGLALARRELAKRGWQDWPLLGVRLYGVPDSLHYRHDTAAEPEAGGKTTLFHGWCFRFLSLGENENVNVHVPYAGTVAIMNQGAPIQGIPAPVVTALPDDNWIDSPAMMRGMLAAQARFQARYPAMTGIMGMPTLAAEGATAIWQCQLEFSGGAENDKGWVRIEHSLDAQTGTPIKSLIDERFSGRPVPNTVTTEPG